MDENFLNLFDKEMIAVNAQAADTAEAIQFLGGMMAAQGYVEPQYWQDVLKREETFPTGLPTQPVAIAIPHADPDRVIKSGIAVAVFQQPVKFRIMGSNTPDTLDVPVVFMLALKDFKQQTAVIRDLMLLIQSGETIQAIHQAENSEAVYQIITKTK